MFRIELCKIAKIAFLLDLTLAGFVVMSLFSLNNVYSFELKLYVRSMQISYTIAAHIPVLRHVVHMYLSKL